MSREARLVVPVRLDQSPPPHVEARYDVSESDHVSVATVESLSPARVVVLGYWLVPDQSSPQQLRDQFEDEARDSIDVVRQPLEDQGFEVTSELCFTKDRDHHIDVVANRHGCTAVLFPGTVRTTPPESVLVLLKPDTDLDRTVNTLRRLFRESDVDLLLFHAAERGDDADAIAYMLRGVADRLVDSGIDSDRIRWEQSDRGSRTDTIVSEVSAHDLVVLGETEPSVRERVFGPVQASVADRTDRPSLTIRAEP